MKNRPWVIVLFLLLLAPLAILAEDLETSNRPRHLIVFIHGIGGSAATFGHMPQLLVGSEKNEGHLTQVDSTTDWRTLVAQYETGNNAFDVYAFAVRLGSQIKETFADKPIGAEDKISIIGHSQGGLISYIWYILALTEPTTFFLDQRNYAIHVDSIITLGTPFWGSNLAVGARYFERFFKTAGIDLPKKLNMGELELKEMVPTSDTMFRFRRRAIEIDQSGFQYPMRPLNIAGVFPKSDSIKFTSDWKKGTTRAWKSSFDPIKYKTSVTLIENILAGGDRLEADIAVLVSRARSDFIYTEALNTLYPDGTTTPLESTRRTTYLTNSSRSIFEFVPLESYHANFFNPEVYDLVAVPEVCAAPEKCDHASYRFVVSHILNYCIGHPRCNRYRYDDLIIKLFSSSYLRDYYDPKLNAELRTFSLDINLRLPKDYQVPSAIYHCQSVYLNCNGILNFVTPTALADANDVSLEFGSKDIPASQTVRESFFSWRNEQMLHLRISLNGRVRNSEINEMRRKYADGIPIQIAVRLPGLKTRVIQSRVSPTFTTFVDAVLENSSLH